MIYVGRRAILYPPPNRANHESSRKCRPTRLRADVLIVRLRSWATVNGFYSPDVVPPGLPPLVIRVALLEAQRRAGSEGTVVGVPVDPSLRTACGCRCRRLSQLIRTGRDGEALRVDALEIGATAMLNSVLFSSPSTATCPPSRLLAGPVTRRLLPRALVARPAGPRLEPLAMLGSFNNVVRIEFLGTLVEFGQLGGRRLVAGRHRRELPVAEVLQPRATRASQMDRDAPTVARRRHPRPSPKLPIRPAAFHRRRTSCCRMSVVEPDASDAPTPVAIAQGGGDDEPPIDEPAQRCWWRHKHRRVWRQRADLDDKSSRERRSLEASSDNRVQV